MSCRARLASGSLMMTLHYQHSGPEAHEQVAAALDSIHAAGGEVAQLRPAQEA
jgi:hypothetical protein